MVETAAGFRNQFWYALRVKPRYEKTTALALRMRGFEEFVPLPLVRRRWSDRVKELEEPFFPGYVFCRFNAEKRLPVLITPGVLSVIGMGKTPAPVEDAEIAALQTVVASRCRTQTWPYLAVGQMVRIEAGPLAGRGAGGVVVKTCPGGVVRERLLRGAVGGETPPWGAFQISGGRPEG